MPLALTLLAIAAYLLFHLGAPGAYERFAQRVPPIILQSAPDGAAPVEPGSARSGRDTDVARPTRASIGIADVTLSGQVARRDLVAERHGKNFTFNRLPETPATESLRASRPQQAPRRNSVKFIRAGSPPARGLPSATLKAAFIHFDGPSDWSIDDFASIQEFYQRTFGRPPPVSAMGQSETHDRLALDHRDAIDIAVRPDSEEGRALMIYLRAAGIPFIAFRGRFRGISTGAHIHIGRPSPRLLEVYQRTLPIEGGEAARG